MIGRHWIHPGDQFFSENPPAQPQGQTGWQIRRIRLGPRCWDLRVRMLSGDRLVVINLAGAGIADKPWTPRSKAADREMSRRQSVERLQTALRQTGATHG